MMDKYAQLKRFNHDFRPKVYMYDFIYVDTGIIPVEELFPNTKSFVENHNKISTPGPVPKIGLRLVTYIKKIMSCIRTLVINNFKTFRPHIQQ